MPGIRLAHLFTANGLRVFRVHSIEHVARAPFAECFVIADVCEWMERGNCACLIFDVAIELDSLRFDPKKPEARSEYRWLYSKVTRYKQAHGTFDRVGCWHPVAMKGKQDL